jgi:hypothetical protein
MVLGNGAFLIRECPGGDPPRDLDGILKLDFGPKSGVISLLR